MDLKGLENIIYTRTKYGETFKGDHLAFNTTYSGEETSNADLKVSWFKSKDWMYSIQYKIAAAETKYFWKWSARWINRSAND